MTVMELQKALAEMPGELPVIFTYYDSGDGSEGERDLDIESIAIEPAKNYGGTHAKHTGSFVVMRETLPRG